MRAVLFIKISRLRKFQNESNYYYYYYLLFKSSTQQRRKQTWKIHSIVKYALSFYFCSNKFQLHPPPLLELKYWFLNVWKFCYCSCWCVFLYILPFSHILLIHFVYFTQLVTFTVLACTCVREYVYALDGIERKVLEKTNNNWMLDNKYYFIIRSKKKIVIDLMREMWILYSSRYETVYSLSNILYCCFQWKANTTKSNKMKTARWSMLSIFSV